MGKKKIEQDLRDAGLRKKRARRVAKAADRARAGDRAARELVEQHSAALRDSVSAVVSHAKPAEVRRSLGEEGFGEEGFGQEVVGQEGIGEEVGSAKKSSAKTTSTKRAPRGGRPPSRLRKRRRQRKPAPVGAPPRGDPPPVTREAGSTRHRGQSAR